MFLTDKTYINIGILLYLGLVLTQSIFAQTVFQEHAWHRFSDGAIAACANELDNDPNNDDIDEDNDGLIELCYLDDVDAVRHSLSGVSLKRGDSTLTAGCPNGCKGYELVRNLDFNNNADYRSMLNITTWTNGKGWSPIGSSNNRFKAIFEGNGHTISNLLINAPGINGVGLFGMISSSADIRNIGLLGVNINGKDDVGSIVGNNQQGRIINSYATGSVIGKGNNIGGLVGSNQGGRITNSYTEGTVKGIYFSGGLAGLNQENGSITNSYATGRVMGTFSVGGLVGYNQSSNITNSYAVRVIEGNSYKGGLIGFRLSGNITESYWDIEASGITSSARGIGKTTLQLQSPTSPGTAAGMTYYGWSEADWNFITSEHYPIPKYAGGNNSSNLACRNTQSLAGSQQPSCGKNIGKAVPVIEAITPASPVLVAEGDAVSLTARVSDENNDQLTYAWRMISGDINPSLLSEVSISSPTLTFGTPTDLVDAEHTQTTLMLMLEVSDGIFSVAHTASVVVTKENNGRVMAPPISVNIHDSKQLTLQAIDLTDDPDGVHDDPDLAYQWQICLGSDTAVDCSMEENWSDIEGATMLSYTIAYELVQIGNRFRVKIIHKDGQNHYEEIFTTSVSNDNEYVFIGISWNEFPDRDNDACATETCAVAACANELDDDPDNDDIDEDNDGLIELCYLEDVDAMRYAMDGSGYKDSSTATKVTTGCGGGASNDTCLGYELVRDLDFNDNASYKVTSNKAIWTTTETSWSPIGAFGDFFATIFEGNGHTISNLLINRPDTNNIGLFGYSGLAYIRNIGLFDVDITGNNNVGGIVGQHALGTRIRNSYITGAITGNTNVGGLFGNSVPANIRSCYVTGAVTGEINVGGLVGRSIPGDIRNSYATGTVTGGTTVGGLIGNSSNTNLKSSYATSAVTGDSNVGGLIGGRFLGNIADSYWNTETSGQSASAGGAGRNTMELQMPTAATGIYENWRDANWDFGTDEQYPTLKYVNGGDNNDPACRDIEAPAGSNQQPPCDQKIAEVAPVIDSITPMSPVLVNEGDTVSFTASASDTNNDVLTYSWSVISGDVTPSVLADVSTNTATLEFNMPAGFVKAGSMQMTLVLMLEVFDGRLSTTQTVSVIVTNPPPMIDSITPMSPVSIYDGDTVSLEALASDANNDVLTYIWSVISGDVSPSVLAGVSTNTATLEFNIPSNLLAFGSPQATLVLMLEVSDGRLSTMQTVSVIVTNPPPVIDSITPMLPMSVYEEDTVSFTASASDANNDVLIYSWSVISGDVVPSVLAGVATDMATLEFNIPSDFLAIGIAQATLVLMLEVSDGKLSTTQTVSVVVTNPPPVIDSITPMSPVLANQRDIVSLEASASDANNDVLIYRWSVISGDVSPSILAGVATNISTLVFNIPSDFLAVGSMRTTLVLMLEVSDGKLSTTQTVSVIVTNTAPTIDSITPMSPISVEMGDTVSLTATASDANNDMLVYSWSVISGDTIPSILTGVLTHNPTLEFDIPFNFIGAESTQTILVLMLEVSDGRLGTMQAVTVFVNQNLAPLIEAITPTPVSVSEGDVASLTASVIDANNDELTYMWRVVDGDTTPSLLTGVSTDTTTLAFDIPTDLVAANSRQAIVVLMLEVSDGEFITTQTVSVFVTKTNNGVAMSPSIIADVNNSRLLIPQPIDLSTDPDGVNNNPAFTYQWQICLGSDNTVDCAVEVYWSDIGEADKPTYVISDKLAQINNEFRVRLSYTDKQNYREKFLSNELIFIFTETSWSQFPNGIAEVCANERDAIFSNDNIDEDNDGLIELCYLEDVYAMRYVLDGSGYKNPDIDVKNTRGCGGGENNDACIGYELVRDLDFNDVTSYSSAANQTIWAAGEGWLPIGEPGAFVAIFEGNGHTISNLLIDRNANNMGLFAKTAGSADIRNIGLLDVDIKNGISNVGSLVAYNEGGTVRIINSYATGMIRGNTQVGGLVGGAFDSINIVNSYARCDIQGNSNVGGLIGFHIGDITNSYIAGNVSGLNQVGRLVGSAGIANRIRNSYAMGDVTGRSASGLIGNRRDPNIIVNSYWDTGVNKQSGSEDDTGKTTTALRTPTTATGIYSEWSTDDWEFGTNSQYPLLKHTSGNDSTIPSCGTSQQLPCKTRLSGQVSAEIAEMPPMIEAITPRSPLSTSEGDTVSLLATASDANFDNLTYTWRTISGDTIPSVLTGVSTDTAILEFYIPPDFIKTESTQTILVLMLEVSDGILTTTQTVSVTVMENTAPVIKTITPMPPVMVSEGDAVSITVTASDANFDSLTYAWRTISGDTVPSVLTGVSTDTEILKFGIPRNFVAAESTRTILVLMLEVSDGILTTAQTVSVIVMKNLAPVINEITPMPPLMISEGDTVSLTVTASDANNDNLTYAWRMISGDIKPSLLKDVSVNKAVLEFNIPTDFIAGENIQETLMLALEVSDGILTTTQTISVYVAKENNGGVMMPPIYVNTDNRNLLTLQPIDLTDDPDDVNNNPDITYQWQVCRGSDTNVDCSNAASWANLSGITIPSYTIPEGLAQLGNRFRVRIRYTDGQNYRNELVSLSYELRYVFLDSAWSRFPNDGAVAACANDLDNDPSNDDIDEDDDGLIELCYLEDVHAMRYVLDGSGYKSSSTATKVTIGCGGGENNNACIGYELVRDLDFNDVTSYNSIANQTIWTTGQGWLPIGEPGNFVAIFEGNGHTISNLLIDRNANNIGFFAKTAGKADIRNLGLVDVDIKGGVANVGGLIANNGGGTTRIINSYATGVIRGNTQVGGLVGISLGFSNIKNSYVKCDVQGSSNIGGVIGFNVGNITNSHAAGSIAGFSQVGGLVGNNGGTITNSYAAGTFTANSRNMGGFAGNNYGTIARSYWDIDTSKRLGSRGGIGKTTAELRVPTAPGITSNRTYYGWSIANWDFGTSDVYPKLNYARGDDTNNPACQGEQPILGSQQPMCGTLLPDQRIRIQLHIRVLLEGAIR